MIRTLVLLLAAIASSLTGACAAEVRAWEIWDNCHLKSDEYFDGDSFHVKHGRTSAIIRLYFVDAPECDDGYGARIAEQAAYFRTTPPAILRAGASAKELSSRFLSQPFRVITRRQVAPGASRSERYYGIVERNGIRLDAALVEAGLARVNSEIADFPDVTAGQRALQDLRAVELKATQAGRGLWARTGVVESMSEAIKRLIPGSAATARARRINLNTATAAELESLPGIGPKLAGQIIRGRPIKDLQALDAIPGIGPKKLEALREFVSF
jgi:DNA uptake protein ComE-like DNA-binding protein